MQTLKILTRIFFLGNRASQSGREITWQSGWFAFWDRTDTIACPGVLKHMPS